MALKNLIKLSWERGLQQIQVYGDSLLLINWIKNKLKIKNITLLPLAEQIKENSLLFHLISLKFIMSFGK